MPGRLERCCVQALLLAALMPSTASADFELRLDARAVRVAQLEIDRLTVTRDDAAGADLRDVRHPLTGRIGSLSLVCERGPTVCGAGSVTVEPDRGETLELSFRLGSGGVRLQSGDESARLSWPAADEKRLVVESLPLSWLRWLVPVEAGLASLSGSLSVDASYSEAGLEGSATLAEAAFDTNDGRFAAGGLDAALEAAILSDGNFEISGSWRGGEMLLGPAYLPPPDPVIDARLAGRIGPETWVISEFSVAAGERLAMAGTGEARVGDGAMRPTRLDIANARFDLAWLWGQGLRSVAAARGWAELSPAGRVEGSLAWRPGGLDALRVSLASGRLDDELGRIAVEALNGSVRWDRAAEELVVAADWRSASLYRLPVGASDLRLATGPDGHLRLDRPVRVPLLDGAVVVDRLTWRNWLSTERELRFDAGLEPIGLPALTRALGWNEFGGRLSGRFDGLRFGGGVAEVEGGLDISLFEGRAGVRRLTVERPFGTSPALSADIEFSELDLELFTRAFEFGRMQGLASGYVRRLRLLNWQPVQFDAWFETLEDSPERVISQQAVDTLSSLSGGGSAAISGLLLQWFDEFPYRKFGLGCRLTGNVCNMRGLSETEEGGYLILDGRGIPRLDIVGYQRRVDWPQLMEQLQSL